MNIDELFQQAKQANELSVPNQWTQGRTVFGGLSAALVFVAIQEKVASGRVLRSLNTNFVGPLLPNEPFSIEVTLLREGANVTQIIGQAIQHNKVCVMSQACFGVARDSKITVENTRKLELELPKKPNFIPQIPKVTPKFLSQVDLALQAGAMPFTGSKKSETGGWMRFKQPPESISDAHLITLIDAWPPTLLQMLRWPAPASTMSWNLEFIHPHQPMAPNDWFAYHASTRQAADGYGHTDANIWHPQGDLIAISRQVVTIFK